MDLINSILFSDKTPKVVKKSVDFNARKASITSSNIANAETPGYKAVRMNFEEELKSAASGNLLKMKTTNRNHIQPKGGTLANLEPRIEVDRSPGRIDGNNVDIDREVTDMAETQIAYEAAISAMKKRGAIVKYAVTDAR